MFLGESLEEFVFQEQVFLDHTDERLVQSEHVGNFPHEGRGRLSLSHHFANGYKNHQ
ncbi:MAG: hypothetical protein ACRCTJ_02200 [Brevinema sp.]